MSDPLTRNSEMQISQYTHPTKSVLLTIGGDDDTDIPPITSNFLYGSAEINGNELPDTN